MGDDVVRCPVDALQRRTGGRILFLRREFFLPPSPVIHPEVTAHRPHDGILLLKVLGEGAQDAVLNVVGGRAAHGEERVSLQFKYLPPQQMDDMRADELHLPAVPLLHRELFQTVEVLMIAGDKQHREG